MQLPFFFEEDITVTQNVFIVSEETSRHCIGVLRMKNGEQLQLTDGAGNLYTCTIVEADKKHCGVKIEESSFEEKGKRNVSIAVSLLKNANRFEWFLEKATEMGVQEIVPLLCKRTERSHFRLDRMKNILVSAMLQSRQVWLPVLQEPVLFEELVASSLYGQKLVATCADGEKSAIKDLAVGESVQLLIGPEGDFDDEEIKLAIQHGYNTVSLGGTRLRTETAAVVAAALLING